MGFVKSVEYVEFSVTNGNTSGSSSTLTKGQDTDNCVPFVTSRVDMDVPEPPDDHSQQLVDVYFGAGPVVTAERALGNGQIDLGVFVVEFDSSKVSVQQGVISFTGTSDTDTVTAVDQSKAAMLFYYTRGTAADVDGWDSACVEGWFSANTTLSWQRDLGDGTITGHFYVFEALNSEFSVQVKTIALGSADASGTATLTSVDTSKTFLITSNRADTGNGDSDEALISAILTNATTITATRGSTGNANDIRVFAVEMSGDESVQRGTFAYPTNDTQETASITSVDTDFAICWNTHNRQGGMEAALDDIGSADVEEMYQRLKFASATSIQGDRTADSDSEPTGRWEVIQFLESAGTVVKDIIHSGIIPFPR